MVGHLSVVDGYLQLSLPRLAGVHAELARLAHNPTFHIRNLNQTRVVGFEKYGGILDLNSSNINIHDEAANLLRVELNLEQAIVFQKPTKIFYCQS